MKTTKKNSSDRVKQLLVINDQKILTKRLYGLYLRKGNSLGLKFNFVEDGELALKKSGTLRILK